MSIRSAFVAQELIYSSSLKRLSPRWGDMLPAVCGVPSPRQCCENYFQAQRVTSYPHSGGAPKERSNERRLPSRIASR
jgi:hypothetical protein